MQIEVGGHPVKTALAFGVVAAVKRKLPTAQLAVNIAVGGFALPHDQDAGLYRFFVESRGLAHKLPNQCLVILNEHGRNYVPFGREIK